MTDPDDNSKRTVDVVAASPENRPILTNLYQLYIHDFSEFVDCEMGEDGRFTYDPLPLYWSESSRFPFLVRVDQMPAGFVLVKKGSEFSGNSDVWDMADFFIVRSRRRCGIATEVAARMWRLFPGFWEVRVRGSNVPAMHFWPKAITEFTGAPIRPVVLTKQGEMRNLFLFQSQGRSATLANDSS